MANLQIGVCKYLNQNFPNDRIKENSENSASNHSPTNIPSGACCPFFAQKQLKPFTAK
jgi:hypothetical protein